MDSCDVQADGGKTKRLSVNVGAFCYSNYDKLLLAVALITGYYFNLEVSRVTNINLLPTISIHKKEKKS